MERALVVYESMFGNTQAIARAVAEGLCIRLDTEVAEVGVAPTRIAEDLAVLVVGAPTHAFGLSRPRTREDAKGKASGELVSSEFGVREWLSRIDGYHAAVAAATFDTRIDKPRVPGSAAHAAQKRLRRTGFRIEVPAQSFYVTGMTGPLVEGEIERARRWGEDLARRVRTAPAGTRS